MSSSPLTEWHSTGQVRSELSVEISVHSVSTAVPRTQSKAFAHRSIGQGLRSAPEEPLSKAFVTHARLLEDWSRKVLAELRARFDSSADVYQAQLARMIGQVALSTDEQQAIKEDFARRGVVGASLDESDGTATAEAETPQPAGR